MAYVPGFKNDVFISYAHVDNKSLRGDEEGWITKLHQSLLNALPVKIGRGEGLAIYRDPKLRGNDMFADALDAEFRQSAVFVSIITPNYIESEWCLRELKGFHEQRHPTFRASVGSRSRIFKVMPSPHVPRKQHPEQLSDTLGYQFYALDQMTEKEEQFRRTKPEDSDQRYWNMLDDLARDIAALLKEMRNVAAGVPVAAVPIYGTVFLAEVTDDLPGRREEVKRYLEQQGLKVLPDAPLPLTSAEEFTAAVRGVLARCSVSVHLLGPYYGRLTSDGARSFPHLQYEEAAREQGVRRIVWLKDGLDPAGVEDPRQKQFIKSLDEETGQGTHVELLKVGVEELKEIILARTRPPTPETDENPFFYISCTQEDDAQARRILACLNAEKLDGLVFTLPAGAALPAPLRKYHRTNLKRCDVFMVLYGNAPDYWVNEKALEAWDVARHRKKKRMELAVCAWPPPPDKQLTLALNGLRVWRVGEQLRCDEVKQFVREVRRA